MPLTPLATLSRATVGGALYVPKSHVSEAVAVARALAKPNPEYASWVRRNKRQGRTVGSPPPQAYTAAGPMWVDDFGAARAHARKRRALYRRLGWQPGAIPVAGTVVHGGVE